MDLSTLDTAALWELAYRLIEQREQATLQLYTVHSEIAQRKAAPAPMSEDKPLDDKPSATVQK